MPSSVLSGIGHTPSCPSIFHFPAACQGLGSLQNRVSRAISTVL